MSTISDTLPRYDPLLRTDRGPELRAVNLEDRSWASFITTFDRPEVLRSTIGAMLGQTRPPSTLLIVDNGTDPGTPEVVAGFRDERVLYVSTGDNLGSAGGTAFGMQWLHQRDFEWISSIDDDDPPRTADTIERLRALIARQDSPDLGAVSAVGSRWDWRTGEYSRLPDDALHGDVAIDVIGGNAVLTVRRTVIDRIGTPEPRFFFGFYDPLYCLRIAQAGFRLMIDGDLMREYRTLAGRLQLEQRRAWVPSEPDSGVWRRYYTTRNYIYRMTRTFDRPDLARREAAKALSRCATAWVRGPRYGARYTSMSVRGILDGYRGRLGRTVTPVAKTGRDG